MHNKIPALKSQREGCIFLGPGFFETPRMWPGDRTPSSYLLQQAAGSFACEMPQGLTPRRFEDGAKIYLISGISRGSETLDGNFNTTLTVLQYE